MDICHDFFKTHGFATRGALLESGQLTTFQQSASTLVVAKPSRSVYIAHKMAADGGVFYPIERHFVSDIH